MEYKSFTIESLFDVKGSKTTKKEILESKGPGKYPYITTKSVNNGLDNSYDYYTEYGNVLTIDSATVGSCFYQERNFSASDHVEVLHPRFIFNQYIGLYLTTVINKNMYKYGYGRKFNQKRIKETIISLPVDDLGQPNWIFIENYIKSLPEVKLLNIDSRKNGNIELKSFDNWKTFKLDDIFEIKGSKTTKKDFLESIGVGLYPYITTKSVNNGLDGAYDYYTEYGNVLTIDSATVGSCFYQGKNFSASDHVEVLKPKFDLNVYTGIFIATVINKNQYKYGYGRKFNQKRIKETLISLPANNLGEIDLEFIEKYMKSLPYSDRII